jgi:hypothetical protein
MDAPPQPSHAGRLATGVVAAALTSLSAWITVRNLSLPTQDGWIFWVPVTLWLLSMALLCWWSTLTDHPDSESTIRASWKAGWSVGAIGLAIGFVGPLLINPEGNLGPLLGILLTGPSGFVAGALGAGLVRAAQGSH